MIKERLKANKVTISEFAQNLQISRPTLDSYIKMYESGQELPNDKYKIVFDILFSDDVESIEEFKNRIEEVKNILHRDSILGTIDLDAEKTDLLTNIIEIAKSDLYDENCDLNVYRFIIMYLNSYKNVNVFTTLMKYFLTLNSRYNIEELEEDDKIALSNYFRIFSKQVNNELEFDQESYSMFLRCVDEIKDNEEKEKEEFKAQVSSLLNERIDELVDQGVDLKNINIQKLISNILNDNNS